jgi:predicted aspartyl protease
MSNEAGRGWRWRLATAAMMGIAPVAWAASNPDRPGQDIAAKSDGNDRMTVGVRIDGRGPFPFVVDTGAERTVISTELAAQLQLAAAPAARLLSLSEESMVPTVLIPRLAVSDTVVEAISAPALARDHLGAAGILGIDTLQNQRVVFDFKHGRMSVSPSAEREERGNGDEIVVRARSRFGRLVLADAAAEDQKVHVIIDSGAQLSVGNPTLLKRLIANRRKHGPEELQITSVTGGKMIAKIAVVRKVRIGGVHLENMPIAITDSEVFRKLGLQQRPALLLGMDVLRSFDRVSIDFANRKVRFLLPGEALRTGPIKNAQLEDRKSSG